MPESLRQHAISERNIQYDITDGIGGKGSLRNLARQRDRRIVECAAQTHCTRDLPRETILFLICEREERLHIHPLDLHPSADRTRRRIIVETRRHRAVRPLTEPRILKLDDPVFIVGETADLREFHAAPPHSS